MDIQRILILLGKEVRLGATNFMSIYVLAMPVIISLLVALVFGDLIAQTPRLGIYDAGGSEQFTQPLLDHPSINTTLYGTEAALQDAVERGSEEVGLSLPSGFIQALESGSDEVNYTVYRWGEAGVRNLLLLESTVVRAMVEGGGLGMNQLPVSVNAEQLGSANTLSWSQRLLPLILIMSIVLGGLWIPAASLIDEKQKRTLVALTSTPTSLMDVYLSKTLMGFILSGIMAVIILLLNGAFAGQIALLLLVIGLGGLMSSVFGVILGSVSKDMDTFMGVIKVMGIVLYAPGILKIFPQVPEWIGRLFPTYYLMNPLLEVSQNGAGFGDILIDVAVLAVIIVALLAILSSVIGRQQQQLALET